MASQADTLPARFAAQLQKLEPSLLSANNRVCIGLSGGLDSVVLLHLAVRHFPCGRFFAHHVHHGLSPQADHWADFCQQLGLEYAIPVQISHVNIGTQGKGLEAAARRARYQALLTPETDYLLLAHHRGDQAETLLHNLIRGCGVLGAAAMPARKQLGQHIVLRPLLDCPRTMLLNYAQQNGLKWIEDESNTDTGFTRNYLRQSTLPPLTERFPTCEANLARAAAHFGEAQHLLDELAEQDWQTAAEANTLHLPLLRTLSPGRIKNLLRYHLRRLAWQQADASRLDEFVHQILTARPDRHPLLTLPDGEMRVKDRKLHFVSLEQPD